MSGEPLGCGGGASQGGSSSGLAPTAQAATRRRALPPRQGFRPGREGLSWPSERRPSKRPSKRRPRRRDHADLHLVAEALPQDRAQIAHAVDEAELEGFPPDPEGAGEELAIVVLKLRAAAAPDQVDEDLVDAGAEAPSAARHPSGPRAGRGRASPCSRPRCGRAARCRSARSGGQSRNSAETTPIEPTIEAGSAKISSAAQAIM